MKKITIKILTDLSDGNLLRVLDVYRPNFQSINFIAEDQLIEITIADDRLIPMVMNLMNLLGVNKINSRCKKIDYAG